MNSRGSEVAGDGMATFNDSGENHGFPGGFPLFFKVESHLEP
jgi:hypothetical protein